MRKIEVNRSWYDKKQAIGILTVTDDDRLLFASVCLERGWRNNEKNVSCIPEGTYPVKWEKSAKFNMMLWEIYGVPNRSECKIHAANYWHQLNGCIAPGRELIDMNNDGYHDVTDSKNTLKAFHKAMEGHTDATIKIYNPL